MAVGRKRKMYLNLGGTFAAPTWVEIKRATEVKRPQSRSTSEHKFRGARNIKTTTGYRKFEVTAKYHTKPAGLADAVADALQDSFDNDTVLDIAVMDGPIATAGTKGVRGPFLVTNWELDENDEDNANYALTLSEADAEQAGDVWEVDTFVIGS